MRRLLRALLIAALLTTSACSTAGGMYTEGDPVNGDFSVWKTAGAVLLGVVTMGAIAGAAYAGAQDSHPTYTTTYVTPSYSYSGTRQYLVNGTLVTCSGSGVVTCY